MSPEHLAIKQHLSSLEEGNKAFWQQRYPAAVALYLQALQSMPQLKKIITFKIRLAWRRYQNLGSANDRLIVALCGSDPAHYSDRLDLFSELYGGFAEVHTLNEDFSKSTSSWISNRNSAFPGTPFSAQYENIFLSQAIQKVAENRFDIVHLLEPSGQGIFFAMLYKLVWGAKVLVDIDENRLNRWGEKPGDIRDYLREKQDSGLEITELKRFVLHLAGEIDSITVSSVKMQQVFGGEIIGKGANDGSFVSRSQIQQLLASIEEFGKDSVKQEIFIEEFLAAFLNLLSAGETASSARIGDAPSLKETSETGSTRSCLVRLEEVTLKTVSGWAICPEDRNERIFLKVTLNDHPLHIVDISRFRNDIKEEYGGEGVVGYSAEMNEYLDFSGHAEISVESISHVIRKRANKENVTKNLPCLLKGRHFIDVNEKAKKLLQRNFYSIDHKLNASAESFSVSIIILNLNGLNVLRRCLQSIYAHTGCDFEVIVIDHGSTDGSVEFLKHSEYPHLRSFFRGKNYSFSAGNNFAAECAQGDILVFMNNDMIIVDDTISAMARTALHSDFGLVGVTLWDMPQGLPVDISQSLNVVQHLGVHFRDSHRENIVEAYETRLPTFWSEEADFFETPAVTAAMMALPKGDFLLVGGFDEEYFYGQEDVDFCLKYMRSLRKKTGVLLRHGAYHARGLTRYNPSAKLHSSLQNNRSVLQQKMGRWLRKKLREDQISRSGYWCPKPYSVAMIVSEIGFETDKADYFTARELGDAIEEDTDAVVGYFSFNENELEVDVSGYNAVIVFIDRFDPARLKNLGPSTHLIAWARNWFDRWCERDWVHMYDLLFASSEISRQYMEEGLQRKVHLLRIAASARCIQGGKQSSKLQSDYCFTGSYFDSPREIAEFLDPTKIPYDFHLFGYNWQNHPNFSKYTKGPMSYEDIPSVYASTKLVVDDANVATKKWGSVNSRVFDAIATGAMCISNNTGGSKEVFGDEFPTYSDRYSLHANIRELLEDDDKRQSLVKRLQKIVLEQHTYKHRTHELFDVLRKQSRKTRVAIKIAAPTLAKSKPWGDLYFATALRKYFEREGYDARIDCMDQWYAGRALGDDVVIVLRGLDRYKPRKDQLNILWVISHPEAVCERELRENDKVYVASELYANKLKDFTEIDHIEFLPQATDFSVAQLDRKRLEETPAHDILFIGNSRGQSRETVRWCVEEEMPISVYGQGWEEFIPERFIVSEHMENRDVPYFYNKAKVVLNDHWPDMRRLGFISNRIWDVLGAGGRILSDYVVGIDSLGSKNVHTFKDREEFLSTLQHVLSSPSHLSEEIFFNGNPPHFFDRVATISSYIEKSN